MIYEIVLKDGNTVVCFGKNHYDLLRMFIIDDIIIVQENSEIDKTTFILRDNISFIRFSKDFKDISLPVV